MGCLFVSTRVAWVVVVSYIVSFLLYGGALQRGGDSAKSDWSCDYLRQRTCGHIDTNTEENGLYWLFSCAHRYSVASQTKPSLI